MRRSAERIRQDVHRLEINRCQVCGFGTLTRVAFCAHYIGGVTDKRLWPRLETLLGSAMKKFQTIFAVGFLLLIIAACAYPSYRRWRTISRLKEVVGRPELAEAVGATHRLYEQRLPKGKKHACVAGDDPALPALVRELGARDIVLREDGVEMYFGIGGGYSYGLRASPVEPGDPTSGWSVEPYGF